MKIVYCLMDSSPPGGVERSICCKANYLADVAGYDVTIITADRAAKTDFYDFSPRIKFIHLKINYGELARLPFIRRFFRQLQKRKLHRQRLSQLLTKLKPDIAISTYSHEMTFLCKIKDGSKKIAEHHFNKSYVTIANQRKSKLSIERLFAILAERRKRRYINKYDAFVVLTQQERQAWKGLKNIHSIPNVLPFYPSRYSNGEHKRLISVGRLTYQKGYSFLLKAWKPVSRRHPDWRLDIFGDGKDYDDLNRQIHGMGLRNTVEIHLPEKNIEEEYINSSLYVMSSLHEGFGLVLTEAMACGLPCISFDCPSGPSEIITHGEDGLLVESENVNKLAEAIDFLIEDKALRMGMGENARENVKQYLPEKIMPRWIALFEQLIGWSKY